MLCVGVGVVCMYVLGEGFGVHNWAEPQRGLS